MSDEEWEESYLVKYNHNNITMYKLGEINTPEDLLLSKVEISKEFIIANSSSYYSEPTGKYVVILPSKERTIWSSGKETIVERGLSLDDLKSRYGKLYRVHQSGIKKEIGIGV